MTRSLKPIEHGTYAGYQLHKRRGVPICDACSVANADYMAQYRASRADVRAEDRRNSRITAEAIRLLIEQHRYEYSDLLRQVRQSWPL